MQMLGARQGMGGDSGDGDYARASSGSGGGASNGPPAGSASKPSGGAKGNATKFDDMDDDIPF